MSRGDDISREYVKAKVTQLFTMIDQGGNRYELVEVQKVLRLLFVAASEGQHILSVEETRNLIAQSKAEIRRHTAILSNAQERLSELEGNNE